MMNKQFWIDVALHWSREENEDKKTGAKLVLESKETKEELEQLLAALDSSADDFEDF